MNEQTAHRDRDTDSGSVKRTLTVKKVKRGYVYGWEYQPGFICQYTTKSFRKIRMTAASEGLNIVINS